MNTFSDQRNGAARVYSDQVYVASASTTPVAAVFAHAFAVSATPTTVSALFSHTSAVEAIAVGTPVSAEFPGSYSVAELVSATFSGGYRVAAPEVPLALSFVRSTARTVTVNPESSRRPFTAGSYWSMGNPRTPRGSKDPSAEIDYSFDWTAWLADSGDTIASVNFSTTNGVYTIAKGLTGGSVCTVLVAGGTVGERAAITCRILTASNPPRSDERTVYLDIEES